MQILDWYDATKPGERGRNEISLSLGVFDGLHPGHRRLLQLLRTSPPEGKPVVVTFRNHPAEILGKNFPGNINSFPQKCENFRLSGIEILVSIDFSPEFSRMTGRDFLQSLLKKFVIRRIVMGPHFRFGYRGDTHKENLTSLLPDCEVLLATAVESEGEKVSSTRIRQLISAGEIKQANRLLFRPFALDLRGIEPALLEKDFLPRTAVRQIWPGEGCFEVRFSAGVDFSPGLVEVSALKLRVSRPAGLKLMNIQEIIFIENRHERSKICH